MTKNVFIPCTIVKHLCEFYPNNTLFGTKLDWDKMKPFIGDDGYIVFSGDEQTIEVENFSISEMLRHSMLFETKPKNLYTDVGNLSYNQYKSNREIHELKKKWMDNFVSDDFSNFEYCLEDIKGFGRYHRELFLFRKLHEARKDNKLLESSGNGNSKEDRDLFQASKVRYSKGLHDDNDAAIFKKFQKESGYFCLHYLEANKRILENKKKEVETRFEEQAIKSVINCKKLFADALNASKDDFSQSDAISEFVNEVFRASYNTFMLELSKQGLTKNRF